MAYAAVISLKHTINRLLNSSNFSITPLSCPEITEFAYKEIESLQQVLGRLDINDSNNERVNYLDRKIREAVCKLEELLESHVSNQFLSQSEQIHGDHESLPLILSLDMEQVSSLTKMLKKLKDEFLKELSNPMPEFSSQEDDVVPSRTYDLCRKKSKMVGLSDQLRNLIDRLLFQSSHSRMTLLIGMAGIGKTTLANEVLKDPSIFTEFTSLALVTIGPKYRLKQVLQVILTKVNPYIYKMPMLADQELAELKRMIYESLKGRRYLIVLDDVWKTRDCDDLLDLFPYEKNGSQILVTTRLEQIADSATKHQMRFLNKEESWHLLREKVFGEKGVCPPQLEKAGKKIAEKCEGLPLTIVMVADTLSQAEKTTEYWNEVAEKENSSVFLDVYNQMSDVLFPSYKYLPQHLKPCFLYLGVFPQKYEIERSKLLKLWSAEDFLEPNMSTTLEDFAVECLEELVSNSVLIVLRDSSISSYRKSSIFFRGIKTCRLHSAFWHLCKELAGKNKFFHILSRYGDGLSEDIKYQRRLCIHKNVLFAIKDVYDSMMSISTAHSLLCTGQHHQYPVPICYRLWLLRVLDALTIRFYEFPIEVLKLIQLRYLSITYNWKLPASISKLWNLECLIVGRHLSIVKSCGNSSYLPIEIWDMKELKHLQIVGSDLPDPCEGSLLPNLLTLLDVSARSCTEAVFEGIPNLEKLGIQIELKADAVEVEPLSCFDHLSHLNKLKSLKCVIVNPIFRTNQVVSLSNFPLGLRKLSLSGFRYPWEEMTKIASLPNLQVLKLKCYAFQGPKWETPEFPRLEFLLIEDTDLVEWTICYGSFRYLRHLIIKHCYKLKIPRPFGYSLRQIEVIDCNPLALRWYGRDGGNLVDANLNVSVASSWDD